MSDHVVPADGCPNGTACADRMRRKCSAPETTGVSPLPGSPSGTYWMPSSFLTWQSRCSERAPP